MILRKVFKETLIRWKKCDKIVFIPLKKCNSRLGCICNFCLMGSFGTTPFAVCSNIFQGGGFKPPPWKYFTWYIAVIKVKLEMWLLLFFFCPAKQFFDMMRERGIDYSCITNKILFVDRRIQRQQTIQQHLALGVSAQNRLCAW